MLNPNRTVNLVKDAYNSISVLVPSTVKRQLVLPSLILCVILIPGNGKSQNAAGFRENIVIMASKKSTILSADEQTTSIPPPPSYPDISQTFAVLGKGQPYADCFTAQDASRLLECYFYERRLVEKTFNARMDDLCKKKGEAENEVTYDFQRVEWALPRIRSMDSRLPMIRRVFEGIRSWTSDLPRLSELYWETIQGRGQAERYGKQKKQLEQGFRLDIMALEDRYSRLVHIDFLRQLHVLPAMAKKWQRSAKK